MYSSQKEMEAAVNQQCAVIDCNNEAEHQSATCWMHYDAKVSDMVPRKNTQRRSSNVVNEPKMIGGASSKSSKTAEVRRKKAVRAAADRAFTLELKKLSGKTNKKN